MNNKDRKVTKIVKTYRLIKFATVVLIVIAIFFARHILNYETISAEQYLHQNTLQTASNLKGRISNSLHEMEALSAKMTLEIDYFSNENIINFLSKHIEDYDYYKIFFITPDRKAIGYQKGLGAIKTFDWNDNAKFTKAISGTPTFISTEINNEIACGYANSFSAPVYDKQGNIIGVVASLVDAQNYLKILKLGSYNGRGLSFILKRNGDFVLVPQYLSKTHANKNFFDQNLIFTRNTKEGTKKLLAKQGSGIFSYKNQGEKFTAAFSEIGDTGFYVLTTLPLNVLILNSDKFLGGITFIVVFIGILLVSLLYYTNKVFKENEKIIYHAAFVDTITGFKNKNKFNLEARGALSQDYDGNYATISIGIRKFKAIEELYGEEYCNKILKDFTVITNDCLPQGSICARDYAADFIVLIKYKKESEIEDFIKEVLNKTNLYNEQNMQMSNSSGGALLSTKLDVVFGVYKINDKSLPIDLMCQRAEIARQFINENALQAFNYYDENIRTKLLADKEIEDEMHSALKDEQFQMFLQPKFFLKDGKLAGAEALVRWIHPAKGMIPPIRFIPLFEHNGFVIQVDMSIWEQACRFIAKRQNEGAPLFPISVNVSRLHLNNDAFLGELLRLVRTYNIQPKYLELELTESACFGDEEKFLEIVEKLKSFGFTISMDDFGTGYSSLNMLRHLPIDVLKLDRGFIKDTIADEKGQIVTSTIVEMASKLNMTTVSEGIETEEQASFLRGIGCQIAQGFLYGKPVSLVDFQELFLKDPSNIGTR